MLSLIIPTYNCADYLDETLGSVLSQLPDDCELIVVDDGSDDGTVEKLAGYMDSAKDNLKIFLNEHKGVSAARNAGIDAAGKEWIAFLDCDDCLMAGFFEKSRAVMNSAAEQCCTEMNDTADLYVFSFERVELQKDASEESVMPLVVSDRIYESNSEFADDYVRTRHLLVYSACNKLYRKSLLDQYGIRFREGMEFGEDRLFNYDYLPVAGRVVTSYVRMFRYMQRNPESASKRTFPDYFNTIMKLHEAKMDCFLSLSEDTSRTEKRAFIGYDLSTEMGRMIDRFDLHPVEKTHNLPLINKMIFGDQAAVSGEYDVIIVLGSRNCGYRAEAALAAGQNNPQTIYVVTGGNMHADGVHTEAGFMADYLKSRGISDEKIQVEDQAENTFRNLELSTGIIDGIKPALSDPRIGVVTAAFHIQRTAKMIERISWYNDKDVTLIPAYGEHTRPDNWYTNSYGRHACLSEIAKRALYCEEFYDRMGPESEESY